MKKYELLKDDTKIMSGSTLYRIKALRDFGIVKKGNLGGYIESENNLSHFGNAWVFGNAMVCDNAEVSGNARVCDNAEVSGNARVCGNAWVSDNAWVFSNARVYDKAWVYGNARVYGNAWVCDNAWVFSNARVYDKAWVFGNARVYDKAWVCDNAEVSGNARVSDDAEVYGNARVFGNASISGNARVKSSGDYIVFKNNWSSGRHFTYTKSNKMWKAGCFYGTGQELIEKAYADSELSGKCYEAYVKFVEQLENIQIK